MQHIATACTALRLLQRALWINALAEYACIKRRAAMVSSPLPLAACEPGVDRHEATQCQIQCQIEAPSRIRGCALSNLSRKLLIPLIAFLCSSPSLSTTYFQPLTAHLRPSQHRARVRFAGLEMRFTAAQIPILRHGVVRGHAHGTVPRMETGFSTSV